MFGKVKPKFRILATMMHLKKIVGDNYFENVVDLGGSDGALSLIINAGKVNVYDKQPNKVFENVNYHELDLDNVNADWEKNDLTICTEVIEHLQNDELLLKKIYKNLDIGGIVFITTIRDKVPKEKFELDKKIGHLRRYNLEKFKQLMENIGFETIAIYGWRTNHYYDNKEKNSIKHYFPELDIVDEDDDIMSSGLLYAGVKK